MARNLEPKSSFEELIALLAEIEVKKILKQKKFTPNDKSSNLRTV